MAWHSITLDSSFSNLASEMSASLATLQSELSKAQNLLNTIQAKIDGLNNSIAIADSLVKSIDKTGAYSIVLSPQTGGWDEILKNAAGAPPADANQYSIVFASLAVLPSLDNIKTIFDAFEGALKTSLLPSKLSVPQFDFTSILTPDLKSLDVDYNVWVFETVGKLFPNLSSKASDNLSELRRSLQDAENAKLVIQENINRFQSAVNSLSSILSTMSSTGVFDVFLPPALGSWIDRMVSEPGAPPFSNVSVCGVCIVGIAPTLSEANDLYNSMNTVLK